jgi:uncharacterized coiled-coil protein SlyX
MTLLSDKLKELSVKYADQHGEEYRLLLELDARLASQDKHLIDEVLAVIEAQDQRRAEIHRLLLVLFARVGGLPPPAIKPLAEPQQIDAVPNDGARSLASRFAPDLNGGHYQHLNGASDAHQHPRVPGGLQ